jgi:AraC-like DNA-binding protein
MKSFRPVFLRLSTADLVLIRSGLVWICTRDSIWSEQGHMPNARPDRTWIKPDRRGTFNLSWMEIFQELQSRLTTVANGVRLRFATPFDVAACQFAVRAAVMLHHHGHCTVDVPNLRTSATHLLRRLEAARKRLKRQFVADSGMAMYAQALQSWQQFIRWVRVHFLDCKCKQVRRQHFARHRRVLVRQFVAWTIDDLAARGGKVLSEPTVRRYVRLALRYVRRGRTGHSIRTLSANRATAAAYFATFITVRLEKKSRKRGKR